MNEIASRDSLTPGQAVLGLIGFGAAGQAFSKGWRQVSDDFQIGAYDLKTDDQNIDVVDSKWKDYDDRNIAGCVSISEALKDVDAVFSLVTADQAKVAALSAAEVIAPGTVFFDCNSCAPATKLASAKIIEASGGQYVDTAVMAPVLPKLHETPLLISGPHSEKARVVLASLGMKAQIVPGNVGQASSIKMMRSVMIKGLEALTLECVLSARKAGVDEEVLASLDASFPGFDWSNRAAYMLERVTTHGVRRAAEMREVVKTVEDLGLSGHMTAATVHWQKNIGSLGLSSGQPTYNARADAILNTLENKEST